MGSREDIVSAQTDEALVGRVAKGDRQAFEELGGRYTKKAYSIALRMTRNREDAWDLAQDALLEIHRSAGTFDRRFFFSSWFYRIVVNKTLNFLKREKLRSGAFAAGMEEKFLGTKGVSTRGGDPADPENEYTTGTLVEQNNPETNYEMTEMRERIQSALQTLSPEQRAVVVLFDLEGFSHREIAELMDCPEGTVMSRLHYGRMKLREQLRGMAS
ncbi:MAG: sigma-70 family RNA polymerase sigma factor [Candidatus Latescibacteria bacterium]|nr:sigma-70 family RNA polymerase sigma factor [Candidatus Latescibacterota bacterium]